jgi:hypothetical protein
MGIILYSLLLVNMASHSGNFASVNYELAEQRHNYSLPLESGYIYRDENKARIMLKFYSGNMPFTKDTDERLHIYISGDIEKDQNDEVVIINSKVFFVRVQLAPFYGLMESNVLRIQGELLISGTFSSTKIYPLRDIHRRIGISFINLPLTQVKSMTALHEQDNDYYKDALRKYFGVEWGISR